jgi:chromosome segregation ATPase
MSDANYWNDEYQREVDQLRINLDKLRSLVESSNTKAVETAIRDLDAKFIRVKEVKKSFGLEMRLVRDRQQRNEFDAKAKMLDQRVDDCNKEFMRLKALNDRNQLVGSQTAASLGSGNFAYSTEGKNNDNLLGEAHRIQDLTQESLNRTKNMIEASKEIGQATLETLRGQKDQIVDITNEVDRIDSSLERAEQLIMNFTRRMATDRLIQLFAAANIVIMLGLILYVAVSGKSLTMGGGSKGHAIFGPQQIPPSRAPTMMPTLNPTESPSLFRRQLRQF